VTRVIDSIIATPAPPAVAKLCDTRSGAWSLCLTRVSYTYNGDAVEVRRNWVDTANHCYRIEQGETV
ncbi:MAG: UTRA domain-containing protein, partial [Bryobacteraceae bacterium]